MSKLWSGDSNSSTYTSLTLQQIISATQVLCVHEYGKVRELEQTVPYPYCTTLDHLEEVVCNGSVMVYT